MINRRQFTKHATISALGTLALAKSSKGTSLLASPPPDKLQIRATTELDSFVAWLAKNNAKGFIGELGFPGDRKKIDKENCEDMPVEIRDDFRKWNALAESWYVKADAARLWATIWATGDWWQDYSLAVYKTSEQNPETVSIANTQARIFEKHLSTAAYERGISVAGAEFAAHSDTHETLSHFSNKKPGEYGDAYQYPSSATLAYLASRGIGLVRIPFRWERIQPQLKGELDQQELTRLKATVASARQSSSPRHPNGIKVNLDVHNFGAYYDASDANQNGKRRDFREQGFGQFLVDLWARLSKEFKGTPNVFYGLMCEPVDAQTAHDDGPRTAHTKAWELASQQVLNELRRLGDNTLVIVSGYLWSSVRKWGIQHPKGWITDPQNNFMYEAHHYWDNDHSGHYCRSYADELALIRGQ